MSTETSNNTPDESIEKALQTANLLATLSNQKRILKEEFKQNQVYYINGGMFVCDQSFIGFLKALVDSGKTMLHIVDYNGQPICIDDLEQFFNDVMSTHFEAVNEYALKFNQIKTKRKIGDIVSL